MKKKLIFIAVMMLVALAVQTGWAEEIDPDWAKRSQENALKRLNESNSDFEQIMNDYRSKNGLVESDIEDSAVVRK